MFAGTQLDYAYNTLDMNNMPFDNSMDYSPVDIQSSMQYSPDIDYLNDIPKNNSEKKVATPASRSTPVSQILQKTKQQESRELRGELREPQEIPNSTNIIYNPNAIDIPKHSPKPQGNTLTTSPQNMYDNMSFNKQFEQQQSLQQAQNYIRKLQEQVQEQSERMQTYNPQKYTEQVYNDEGYFDKIFSKKKEFIKLLQWSFIILFALSLYYFIDHYLQYYINANDFTFEKELCLRCLIPLAILFIVWNLRVFSK